MSLASINYRNLSDHQRIDLINRLIVILTPLASTDSEIAELIEILSIQKEKLVRPVAGSEKSSLSERITRADGIRDSSLTMIAGTCRLFKKKENKRFREAAELIESIYSDTFEGISFDNNTEETPAVDQFLTKIATETATQAINTLSLTGEIDSIKTAQPEYISLVAERERVKAGDTTPHLVPTRRELNQELNHLVSYMNYRKRRGSDLHIQAINEMNEPIKAIAAAAKAEQTRNESDEI